MRVSHKKVNLPRRDAGNGVGFPSPKPSPAVDTESFLLPMGGRGLFFVEVFNQAVPFPTQDSALKLS
ncbi:MAG: hypothetical protein ACYCQI_12985 [Gammaproteobacteria bacterium]